MSTVQIIGIAVASLAVLLLVVALLATRRRHKTPEAAPAPEHASPGSFLDEAPQDTLSGLGQPEQPVEDVTVDPAVQPAAAVSAPLVASDQAAQPGGLGLDWGPDLSVREREPEPPEEPDRSVGPAENDETEITGELAADASPAPTVSPPPPEGGSGDQATAEQPARPAEGGSAAGDVAAPESGSGGRLVPLSDIIVTTSSKMVDLEDPDVRHMLTDLVTYEIDQASELRQRGQTIDAVLQLTEAEKVSRALGMTESAQRIRAMMRKIQSGG
jgi:hypothetical protein